MTGATHSPDAPRKSFGSDNHAGTHPAVMRAIVEANTGDAIAYGADPWTAHAVSEIRRLTGAQGEARANLHVGATAKKTDLTRREREICAALGPVLREQGLVFVGIDVIGEYLTEINVTSPTGIQEINRLDGKQLEKQVWDAIEARLKARGSRTAA